MGSHSTVPAPDGWRAASSSSVNSRSQTWTSSIDPVKYCRLSMRWPTCTPNGELRLTEPTTSAVLTVVPSTDSVNCPPPRRSTAWCHWPSL